MKLSLRRKITGSILISFTAAAIVFSLVLIPLHNRRTDNSITESTRLLKILLDREAEPIANALFEGRARAVDLRRRLLVGLAIVDRGVGGTVDHLRGPRCLDPSRDRLGVADVQCVDIPALEVDAPVGANLGQRAAELAV